jgi:hypothetical protein
MKENRLVKRIFGLGLGLILVIGLALSVSLVGGVAGATGQCESNDPSSPSPSPSPTTLQQKVLWQRASIFVSAKRESGKTHYTLCHPWEPH